MVGTLIKQPNGKYCVINYADEVTHYNLTELDIIDMYIKDAKACIGNASNYGYLISKTIRDGHDERTNNISDNMLKEMGFDKKYNELVKFVPRKPIHQVYVSCDFATYGECPSCGKTVADGMGHKDEKCKHCGQLLKW